MKTKLYLKILLAAMVVSSIAFNNENHAFAQEENSNLIHIGYIEREPFYLEKNSIRQPVAGSEERFFNLLSQYRNGMAKSKFRGSCNSASITLEEVVLYNSTGEVEIAKKFDTAWKYPQTGSVLRNALKISCRLG
jgi:hypothetical protein